MHNIVRYSHIDIEGKREDGSGIQEREKYLLGGAFALSSLRAYLSRRKWVKSLREEGYNINVMCEKEIEQEPLYK